MFMTIVFSLHTARSRRRIGGDGVARVFQQGRLFSFPFLFFFFIVELGGIIICVRVCPLEEVRGKRKEERIREGFQQKTADCISHGVHVRANDPSGLLPPNVIILSSPIQPVLNFLFPFFPSKNPSVLILPSLPLRVCMPLYRQILREAVLTD